MKPEELQELKDSMNESIKEAHLIGLQSGKQETSGLVDLVIHKLETKIEESINKNVNGKIITLTNEFREYVKQDTADKKTILDWQDVYSPYLKVIANLSISGKMLMSFLLGLSAVIAGVFGTYKLVRTF